MQTNYPEIYTQYLASILIAFLVLGFIITIFLLYQKKKLVQEKEMQTLKASFDRELLQTRLEIQETVLKNISMEIHDNIGQIMLLANVNLSLLQSIPQEVNARELIIDTKGLISKATEDLSQLSRGMNSDRITEIGVFLAIKHELTLMEQKGLFQVSYSNEHEYDGTDLAGETQLLIFRMFQEIVNNIIKHANASVVTIKINTIQNGILRLQVSDNGKGFIVSPPWTNGKGHNGVGMRSLQSRAKLFGGNLDITSVVQEGTTISIFIPTDNMPISNA